MTRDDGWRFLGLGRHLERLTFVASTLELLEPEEAASHALLEWLLELSDSLLTYRARYVRQPEWPAVVDLLVFDARNPRSVLFQLAKLAKHVPALPGATALDAMADIDGARADVPRRQPAPGRPVRRTCRSTSCSRSCLRAALGLSDGAHAPLFQPRLRAAARDGRPMSDDARDGAVVYRIEHETRYVHAGRVSTSQHVACLTPRALPRQHVRAHRARRRSRPGEREPPHRLLRQRRGSVHDPDAVLGAARREPQRGRGVAARGRRRPGREPGVGRRPQRRWGSTIASEFRYPSPYVEPAPELAAFAREAFTDRRPLLAAAVDLMHRIHDEFRFDPGRDDDHDAGHARARGAARRLPGLRAPADRAACDRSACRRATSAAIC